VLRHRRLLVCCRPESVALIHSVVHHLGIGLRDPRAAEAFFDALFVAVLGLEKEPTQEAVAGWKGRGARFYLYPVKAGAPPGALQHLAFTARSRAEVDRFAERAEAGGFELLSPPREYAEYGGGYYAVFFAGPEGLRLEVVHLTEDDGGAPL